MVTEVRGDMEPLEPGVKALDPLLPADPAEGGEERALVASGPAWLPEAATEDLRCV